MLWYNNHMLPPFGGIERSGHHVIRNNTAVCPSCRKIVDARIKKIKQSVQYAKERCL
jgi:uncharacterized radical SAM superfamily Fe-S cluster-containing enzyme